MVKLKPLHWIIIISLAVVIPLSAVFVITRIIINPPASWWWFFGVLILQAVVGVVFGIVMLIMKLQVAKPVKMRLDPKTAKDKAIHEKKYDPDNPDNFEVKKQVLMRVGEPNAPRTPVLWLSGRGSESNQQIDCVINLDNHKFEASWLDNATPNEIKDAIRLMAENPETEVVEQSTMGVDQFGRPTTTVTKRMISQREKEEKEQQKEADMQNVM